MSPSRWRIEAESRHGYAGMPAPMTPNARPYYRTRRAALDGSQRVNILAAQLRRLRSTCTHDAEVNMAMRASALLMIMRARRRLRVTVTRY